MKKVVKFFQCSSFVSGIGFGVFAVLGASRSMPFFPSLIGSLLFLMGLLALICDTLYYRNNTRDISDFLNLLVEKLPLKKFSPGQTLLIFVTVFAFLAVISIIIIQSIYKVEVFTNLDLRLGTLVIFIVIIVFTIIYGIGELMGIKLMKKRERH
ncbi:MAG: hypothetical protein ACOYVD_02845 [Bacillota bacterium]